MRLVHAALSVAALAGGCEAPGVEFVRTFDGHTNQLCDLTFAPDGKRLISAAADGTVRIWEVETGMCLAVLDAHKEWAHAASNAPDGRLLASGGRDSLVKLWNADSGELVKTLEGHRGIVFSVDFSPDGARLASLAGGELKIWDVASGECLATYCPQSFFTPSMACYTRDGKHLLFAADTYQWLDAETGELLHSYDEHVDSIRDIVVSPDGRRTATAGKYEDHSVRLWDVGAEKSRWAKDFEDNRGPWSITFAADGRSLVSGHLDGKVRRWDCDSGKLLESFQAGADVVRALAVDASGHHLAVGIGNSIKLRPWPKAGGEQQP